VNTLRKGDDDGDDDDDDDDNNNFLIDFDGNMYKNNGMHFRIKRARFWYFHISAISN
jgi:hypothetical protein